MSKLRKQTSFSVVRQIKDHPCNLVSPEDIEVSNGIYSGPLVLLRRKLWKWRTISSDIPESKNVLKSTAQMYTEEQHHFDHCLYMIHPFSRVRFWWEMCMIPVFLGLFIFIPAEISSRHPHFVITYMKLFCDGICYIDVILNFVTGYYNQRRQAVEMRCKSVVKRYLKGFFVPDVVSSLPIHMYIYLSGEVDYHPYKTICLLKVVRLPTLVRYLYRMSEKMKVLSYQIKFICFALWVLMFVTWFVSMVYMIVRVLHEGYLSTKRIKNFPMLMSTFRVVRACMVIGVTDIVNTTRLLMGFEIITIIIGDVLQIVILAKVMHIFQKRSTSRNKYNNLLEEISEYMKYKELPSRLKDKVFTYIEFKFQKHIIKEEDILNTLSSVLKQDILTHRCQRMVERVVFFKGLPTQVLLRIVTKLRSEIFLPNDVIVLAGYAGYAMYFIYSGTVAVYTNNGKEICHLEDGSHFGEIALVINEPRVATVIAVRACEVFKLSRKDFQEAIEPFPDLNKRIRLSALSRLENTLQMMSKDEREVHINDDAEVETDENLSDAFSL